jgi:formylglycine-generating enzyme required for sulfatase activity
MAFEPEMVFVEGGTFTMGCTSEQGGECLDSEQPLHRVTLSNFQIGKYEVTQAQWQAVMGNNPSHFIGCEDCPVENVSWYELQNFIRKLNK